MIKVIRRYRLIMAVCVFILLIMTSINILYRIKIDRLKLINTNIVSYEDEFKLARQNTFVEFKNNLLENNIILDNIEYLSDDIIRFDINQTMYMDDITRFLEFLNNTPYLRINRMNMIKNNLEYNLNISAEI